MTSTSAAIAITVQRETSPRSATTIPSSTAIQSASRRRRSLSQRPARELPLSITGWLYAIASTVPRWCGDPGSPTGPHSLLRSPRFGAVEEESVDRRSGARDVGAEGAQAPQFGGERRGGEVVRRERGEIARAANRGERGTQGVASVGEAPLSATCVEGAVDVRRGRLGRAARMNQEHPVVLR